MFDHLPDNFRCLKCGLGTEIVEFGYREIRYEAFDEDTGRTEIEDISITEWECRDCDATGEHEQLPGVDRALGT